MTTIEVQTDRHGVAVEWLTAQVEAGNEGFNGFYADLLSKCRRYGHLTPAQVDAVHRGIERETRFQEQRAADAAACTGPLVEGHRVITGQVITTKWKDGIYPGYKMLVKEADGNKVWGTLPASLDPELTDLPVDGYDGLVGQTVTFTATVTRSDRDEHFGFFKRPTRARLGA